MNFFNENISVSGIIIFIIAILEGLVYIQTLIAPITANPFNQFMSWRRFNRLIKSLAKKIKSANREYGLIVAYGRGGAICAGLLSRYLDNTPVLILDRKYTNTRDKAAKFHESVIILDQEFAYLKNKQVLLLSQQSDPGITLKQAEMVLKNSGFTQIHRYAILKSKKSLDTDFVECAYEYSPEKKCKKFPWEKIQKKEDLWSSK